MGSDHVNHFDIIVAGAGISGYSLLYQAMKAGIWADKQVLFIDKSFGNRPNKMISFWADSATPFRDNSVANWKKMVFYSYDGKKMPLDVGGYEYFSIDSKRLFETYHGYLSEFPNLCFLEAEVFASQYLGQVCAVNTSRGDFTSTYVFSSLFERPDVTGQYQYFLQHFKGVQIQVNEPLNSPDEAVIMDYRTGQQYGATFFYCLPLSSHQLFVEYTLFSKSLLEEQQYDDAIEKYITSVLGITNYVVLEEEKGVIPMTDYPFIRHCGNITYLGTAGGDTRGSTGYTFTNVQRTIGSIINAFQKSGTPFFETEHIGAKEKLYDATLLAVLNEGNYQGHEVFTDLFRGTKAERIFRFLDSDSPLSNDLKIMLSLRKWPFAKHFIKALLRK